MSQIFTRLAMVLAIAATAVSRPTGSDVNSFEVPCLTCDRTHVPYHASAPLDSPSSDVTSAVVIIQGINRDASSSFDLLQKIASQSSAGGPNQYLLAPHFQDKSDDPSQRNLYWSGDNWSIGLESETEQISSFAVLDAMLSQAASSFSSLQTITVVGFSAGGQAVSRYAALSSIASTLASVKIRYVVASPGTFMYATAARADPSILSGSGTSFAGLGASDFKSPFFNANDVPGYNKYRYGVENRSGYAASSGGADADVLARLLAQDIQYVVGGDDNKNNFNLEVGPEAMAQGKNRVARSQIYVKYLAKVLQASHANLNIVNGCGHDDSCVLGDATTRDLIFGGVV